MGGAMVSPLSRSVFLSPVLLHPGPQQLHGVVPCGKSQSGCHREEAAYGLIKKKSPCSWSASTHHRLRSRSRLSTRPNMGCEIGDETDVGAILSRSTAL